MQSVCLQGCCCAVAPVSRDASTDIFIYLFIYLEALIKQYITNIEQKKKRRDVFDKGLVIVIVIDLSSSYPRHSLVGCRKSPPETWTCTWGGDTALSLS